MKECNTVKQSPLAGLAAYGGGSGSVIFGRKGVGGYTIERSLRFNSVDNSFLNRLPSTASNRRTFTFSTWIKKTTITDSQRVIFSAHGGSGNAYVSIDFRHDCPRFLGWNGGSVIFEVKATQVLRDPSAWYHIVWAIDTTQATAANRAKLYINGVQVTDFQTASYPGQNDELYVNTTNTHKVGGKDGINQAELDCYLADVHFIDGTALDPSSFGETNEDGVWDPKRFTGSFGTNGFHLLDFADEATIGHDASAAYITQRENQPIIFSTNDTERMRLDSGGNLGLGTDNPQAKLHISDDNGRLRFTNTTGSGTAGIDYYANATERGYTRMDFSAGALAIGTNPAWPITFTTNTAERARIDSDGNFLVGKNELSDTAAGLSMRVGGVVAFEATVSSGASHCMMLNRQGDDGAFVKFRQANTLEGTITVSGSTVSYNGGHLARWSQLADSAERTEILRGSVLSNLDEMCEWGEEDNEQLNRMKISDVEGDVNVSGVFQDWDDNDDTYTNDFYCAMTGDFVSRIAQGTTVARGDLLMSAGDGTAKPQDDDIVRSKTIAKVTSTTVSTTYSDGSYCVPCVLMAC